MQPKYSLKVGLLKIRFLFIYFNTEYDLGLSQLYAGKKSFMNMCSLCFGVFTNRQAVKQINEPKSITFLEEVILRKTITIFLRRCQEVDSNPQP